MDACVFSWIVTPFRAATLIIWTVFDSAVFEFGNLRGVWTQKQPLTVFLVEKSCNQVLIPKAQTRWWELKSWISLGLPLLLSSLCVCLLCVFLLCFFLFFFKHCSVFLCSFLPPPSIWFLVVYDVRKPGKLTCRPESKPIWKHYFHSCMQREEGVGLCWNEAKRKSEGI